MRSPTPFSLVKPLAVVAVAASALAFGGTASAAALQGTMSSVPEPQTLALFAVGLAALAFALGRRRKTARKALAARFGAMRPTV